MDPGAQIRALELLSGVRRLPLKEAKILSEEHWGVASHGRSEARSSAAQDRLGYSAYGRSDQNVAGELC